MFSVTLKALIFYFVWRCVMAAEIKKYYVEDGKMTLWVNLIGNVVVARTFYPISYCYAADGDNLGDEHDGGSLGFNGLTLAELLDLLGELVEASAEHQSDSSVDESLEYFTINQLLLEMTISYVLLTVENRQIIEIALLEREDPKNVLASVKLVKKSV
jgi:hypothetical protein